MFDEDVYDDADETAEDESASTYLTFDLGGQTIGVEVRHVREIIDRRHITRLPNAPVEVQGVVDVRGRSVPIVDLRGRLGMHSDLTGDDARIVVLEFDHAGAVQAIGVEADRVRNVDQIGPEEIEPVPRGGLGRWDAGSLQGLCRRGEDLIVLIDLDRVLGDATTDLDLVSV